MYLRRKALYIHLHQLKRPRLRRRLALSLFVLAASLFTLLRTRVASSDPPNDTHIPANLHITEAAAYDFLHTDMSARPTIKYFKHDRTNVRFLIENCRVPPLFVSSLGRVGRARLLARLTRHSNGVPLWSAIPKILVIDLQNGLGNRLRALASAMQFAFLTHRVLVVVWAPDAHIRARLPQLLDPSVLSNLILIETPIPWPLEESQLVSFASGASHVPSITRSHPAATSFAYYSFMQKDNGFRGVADRTITNDTSKHIYIKTAYLIESNEVGNELLNVFIQVLKPAPRVMQLVHSVEDHVGGAHILRKMVGVHLRSRSIINDNSDVDSECEYSLEGAKITDKWRKMSTPKQFVPEMKRIYDEWPAILERSEAPPQQGPVPTIVEIKHIDTAPVDVRRIPKFFVCVDSVQTFEKLSKNFPKDSLVSLPRKCDDRGAECMTYAFADLVLLSRTGAMLASGWSSFSEVAMRMRVRPHGTLPSSNEGFPVRISGFDFGKPSYSMWDKLRFRAVPLLKKWSHPWKSEHIMTQEEQLQLCKQKRSKSTVK